VLTGIKPTGELHLGNYFGAVRPALELAQTHDARFFVADVHALNLGLGGPELARSTLDIAAGWIACGLDPERTLLYRQSEVPEILELATLLMPLCPKGLMNRAHAYKARVADNAAGGRDPDEGVNMGLFTYRILMAADILAFDIDLVPVGADQVQHVEMTVDLARAAGRRWGADLLRVPRALLGEAVALVPGTNGQKMSKSQGNTLPLFGAPGLRRKAVRQVPTDSRPVDAPKDPGANVLAAWMALAAPGAEARAFEDRLRAGGLGWGAAKDEVAEAIDRLLAPAQARYAEVRADEEALERILRRGAQRARAEAQAVVARVRAAVFGR